MDRSLNISDPQVLVHFPHDAHGFEYHHRVLLHKISQGRWVVLSPDLELSVEDLSATRHIVLGRHAPFPAHIADACYIFDDVTKAELERQKRLARTMASILDDSETVNVDSLQWIGADPASARFGKHLPDELLTDVVNLAQHGVVQWDDDIEYVREMTSEEVKGFIDSKKDSTGDLRTLGDHRDAQGQRVLPLSDAVTLMRQSDFDDWPFKGPRTVLDYLKAILTGPGDITTYHMAWVRTSGVAMHSAIAHEHRSLCEVVRLAVSKDQVDVSNLASFEYIARRLVVLEIAVSRSPQAPDFQGLDLVTEAPIGAQGQAVVPAINSWITERLKERANIQKQSRLYREEFNRRGKKGGDVDEDDEVSGGKRWRKKKGKHGKGGQDAGGALGSTGA
jgi:hypothetical protein